MSDLQGRRIPGEEGSGGGRRWLFIVLGLILLLLLALLIPFACQSLRGDSGGGDGSGAQGSAEQSDPSDANEGGGDEGSGDGSDDNSGDGSGETGGAQEEGDGAGGDKEAGSGGSSQGEVAAASLKASDQKGGGNSVSVPEATVEGTKGWLAVRTADGGRPGEVLGWAPLQAGTNENVAVDLRRPLDSSRRLYTTVHAERPADGDFTYPDGDPTLERDGRVVAEPISYAVIDPAPGDTANDGIRGDELPESGGLPPAAVLLTATSLLAAGAWGIRAALR